MNQTARALGLASLVLMVAACTPVAREPTPFPTQPLPAVRSNSTEATPCLEPSDRPAWLPSATQEFPDLVAAQRRVPFTIPAPAGWDELPAPSSVSYTKRKTASAIFPYCMGRGSRQEDGRRCARCRSNSASRPGRRWST